MRSRTKVTCQPNLKATYEEMQTLEQRGLSRAEIARFFGCSKALVTKKLGPKRPGVSPSAPAAAAR